MLIETELDLVITSPNKNKKIETAQVKWFGNKIDIGENATALYLTGQAKSPNGSDLSYSAFCKLYYIFFGLECAEPHDIKRRVTDRKKNATPFLNSLILLMNNNNNMKIYLIDK